MKNIRSLSGFILGFHINVVIQQSDTHKCYVEIVLKNLCFCINSLSIGRCTKVLYISVSIWMYCKKIRETILTKHIILTIITKSVWKNVFFEVTSCVFIDSLSAKFFLLNSEDLTINKFNSKICDRKSARWVSFQSCTFKYCCLLSGLSLIVEQNTNIED